MSNLKITYKKIFAELIHTRIAPLLDANQCYDQVGFRRNLGVDHAFATLDSIVGKCLECNEPLWMVSSDLRKALDRIEFDSLFATLCHQEVPSPYIHLLSVLFVPIPEWTSQRRPSICNSTWCQTRRRIKSDFVQRRLRTCMSELEGQIVHTRLACRCPKKTDKCEICG